MQDRKEHRVECDSFSDSVVSFTHSFRGCMTGGDGKRDYKLIHAGEFCIFYKKVERSAVEFSVSTVPYMFVPVDNFGFLEKFKTMVIIQYESLSFK